MTRRTECSDVKKMSIAIKKKLNILRVNVKARKTLWPSG